MQNNARVKYACYTANLSMSIVGNLSPILFVTFRNLYGISYSLLGMLVLVNFVTQLIVDVLFSFFSHKFNIPVCVKLTPVLVILGLLVYALYPLFLPQTAYVGLVIGTIIFSAAGGFGEVLISPVIAALPSDNPEREMSKTHSIYAWGVVGVIVIGTLYLLGVGEIWWQYLALGFTAIPLVSAILFLGAKLPTMETPEKVSGVVEFMKNKTLWLCVLAIFLGGATECTMAQWSSSYIEQALQIPKVWGDIFGVALFGMMLGIGRSLYAKMGKNIEKFLFLGALSATVCYVTAAVSGIAVIGLLACGLTGFCASMLWPGTLIVAADKMPTGGVFMYALLAAGGDLGASVAPQLVGIIADGVTASAPLAELALSWGMTAEQLGMKAGILVGAVFALLATLVFGYILKTKKKTTISIEK
ncbi:MAG: MFS transporter [Clostridia bacterium]|nr:MFS transporter [Clostridia bacterium]